MPEKNLQNVKTKTAADGPHKVTAKQVPPVRAKDRMKKNRRTPRNSRPNEYDNRYSEERKTVEDTSFEVSIAEDLLTESGDLPESYGASKVVFMPVDAYLMHVYWEIDPQDIEAASKRLAGKFDQLQPVLRFFDITNDIFDGTNACDCFDIAIDLRAGNWYVRLLSPGKVYFVDLGIKTESGIFFAIARSNAAELHQGGPQPEEAERHVFVSRYEAPHVAIPQPAKAWKGLLHQNLRDITDVNEISFIPGISSLSVVSDD
jgi:hypothetical protein